MKKLDRRTFVGLSAAAVACAFSKQIPGQSIPPHIAADDQSVHVSSSRYSWSYSRDNDTFRLMDAKRRLIVTGSLQPAVVVASSADPRATNESLAVRCPRMRLPAESGLTTKP